MKEIFLFKFSFNRQIYTTKAVSYEEALSHLSYTISKRLDLPYHSVEKSLKYKDKFYIHTEYRVPSKKINSLYKELLLEDMRRHELEMS